MKKLLLLAPCLLFAGCMQYGSGETIGYVYSVDDGILWDKVWYKSSLESSQSDCYLIRNDDLKQKLKTVVGKSKVKLTYNRHLLTVANCGGAENDDKTNDEITGVELLD